MQRLHLLIVPLVLMTGGCAVPFTSESFPAVVGIRCGSEAGVGWVTPIEITDDGWRSYVVTSADLVAGCVRGDPVELPAEMVIQNEVDLVRVHAGSANLVGHVYNSDGGDGLSIG